jgi:acetolactate synthase-1/2/3 large subunit
MTSVAKGFGLRTFRVEKSDELDAAMDEAFASRTPVFLDVVTESELSELPPVYSWLKKARELKDAPS